MKQQANIEITRLPPIEAIRGSRYVYMDVVMSRNAGMRVSDAPTISQSSAKAV